ncbi:sensor histidine kinase [Nostoc sp.]|uniref:sensor histidine kinase n=1 Tax=Nostoc sp. TaxID=1180 RepID=UPI003FA59980
MRMGVERISKLILSLRNFSRLDEAGKKEVDVHEGLDSTLLILQNRLEAKGNHPDIQVIKEYGNLSKVECYPGQLNQVFMNILNNSIDILKESISGCHLLVDNVKITHNQQLTTKNLQIRIYTEVLDSIK